MPKQKYEKEKCHACGQTTTYALTLDRGTLNIVKAIASKIRIKGQNIVHPMKEMVVNPRGFDYNRVLQGEMTPNMYSNMKHATAHGLIAKVKGYPGNYCLTTKGANFLKGQVVERTAIRSKVTKHTIGYLSDDFIDLQQLEKLSDFWQGLDYEVVEGTVQLTYPRKQQTML